MKKNKKLVLAVVALVVLVALLVGVYVATRPETEMGTGDKSVCVQVIHSDGSERVFLLHYTDTRYLGELLISEGIIEGEDGP